MSCKKYNNNSVYLDKPKHQRDSKSVVLVVHVKLFNNHQNLHLVQVCQNHHNCHTLTVTCFQTEHLKQSYHEGWYLACHQHWPEIGSEGLGQVDTEQNTDFLQIVMKHLHRDTKQEGAFVVVEVDGGHLHDQQRSVVLAIWWRRSRGGPTLCH